ncbi:MAG: hypothetical protein ABFC63_08530 [Thermoguttaceae bacterium]
MGVPVRDPDAEPAAPLQPTATRWASPRGTPDVEAGKYANPQRPPRRMTRQEIQQEQTRQRAAASANNGLLLPGAVRTMPIAPTEDVLYGTPGIPEMPPAPTPGSAAPSMSDQQTAAATNSRMPYAPTYRPPAPGLSRQSSYSLYTAIEQQRQAGADAAFRNYAPAAGPEKVFAGTQVVSSGVSPYLQLFRNDTSNGTIDNYSTLVRPQLQQQRLNQQFGNDMFGLQRDNRLQQASLQRVQTNVRSLQGVGTPQYYSTGVGALPYGSPMDNNSNYGATGYGYGYGAAGSSYGAPVYGSGAASYGYPGQGR